MMIFVEFRGDFRVNERDEGLRFHEGQKKWNIGFRLIGDKHRSIEVLRRTALGQPLFDVGVFAGRRITDEGIDLTEQLSKSIDKRRSKTILCSELNQFVLREERFTLRVEIEGRISDDARAFGDRRQSRQRLTRLMIVVDVCPIFARTRTLRLLFESRENFGQFVDEFRSIGKSRHVIGQLDLSLIDLHDTTLHFERTFVTEITGIAVVVTPAVVQPGGRIGRSFHSNAHDRRNGHVETNESGSQDDRHVEKRPLKGKQQCRQTFSH